MKLKKYLFVFILVMGVLILISPSNAFTIQKTNNDTVYYTCGISIINTKIISNSESFSLMKKDLNSIDKVVVKIDEMKVNTISKKTGWKRYKTYPKSIELETLVSLYIKNSNVTINVYNKKDKLLDSRSYIVKVIKIKPIKTKTQALKIAKFYKNRHPIFYPGNTVRYSKGFWYIPMFEKRTKKFAYELGLHSNGKRIRDRGVPY